ncbi:hypothetical protein I4F81_003903 [Pyropia yezoensis]|uniref:Uncharacterized protein n=1 Tax=Pyropia yezoensis TaxID=2788 RepID=A0ACC3BTF5_PYRYE|nr:hypothetical protein I4F81_003903 [Neopyropia yezoensis]
MGHSSWRKAAPRREHKERSQPAARARKWSLLEKKKDYTLRARDYHSKQARLAVLRDKAAARNPDEFYHRMARTVTDGGAGHRRREGAPTGPYAEALPLAQRSAEEQMLGDTADARYVGVKAAVEAAKRVAKLEAVRGDVELIKRLRGKGAKYRVRKRNPDTGAPAVYKWRQVRSK